MCFGHLTLNTVCFCGTTGISSNNSFVQHPAAEIIVFALISERLFTLPLINSAPNSAALLLKHYET